MRGRRAPLAAGTSHRPILAGRRARSAAALLAAAALAGCGLATPPPTVAPTVTPAASALAWTCPGPATAVPDAAALSPVTADPTPALPVTVTDVSGEQVTVSDTSRILALDTYGTLGSTVYALGLGDRMVGRDTSTGVPALANLPVVTRSGHNLDAEAILALDPTVVLTDYSIGPLEVQLQLRDAGIPVVFLDPTRSSDQIVPQIEKVAQVLGVPAAGRELAARTAADIASAEAEVAQLAAGVTSPPRVVFLYVRGTAGVYYWFGEGSGADDLIASLGAIDVASSTGLRGEQPVNAEGMSRADPQLLLVMTKGLESVGGIDGLVAIPGVAQTAAGTSRCVVDMRDDLILGFGPAYGSVVRALAPLVYGQRP